MGAQFLHILPTTNRDMIKSPDKPGESVPTPLWPDPADDDAVLPPSGSQGWTTGWPIVSCFRVRHSEQLGFHLDEIEHPLPEHVGRIGVGRYPCIDPKPPFRCHAAIQRYRLDPAEYCGKFCRPLAMAAVPHE